MNNFKRLAGGADNFYRATGGFGQLDGFAATLTDFSLLLDLATQQNRYSRGAGALVPDYQLVF